MLVPTADELLLLPYGDSAPSGVPSVDDLLNITYAGPPASAKGLLAQSYRERMRANGERVSWLRAVESQGEEANRQRLVFAPQLLDTAVRVFIYSNMRGVEGQPYGEIATGETRLSWMPDELQPVRNDRFVALDRTFEARDEVTPSGTVYEELGHKQLAAINAVYLSDEPVATTNYALVNGRLMWINGFLPIAEVAVVVLYSYHPTYELLGDNWKQGPLGQDGVRLPSSAPLRLLSAGEE